jgi:hypothetical protein
MRPATPHYAERILRGSSERPSVARAAAPGSSGVTTPVHGVGDDPHQGRGVAHASQLTQMGSNRQDPAPTARRAPTRHRHRCRRSSRHTPGPSDVAPLRAPTRAGVPVASARPSRRETHGADRRAPHGRPGRRRRATSGLVHSQSVDGSRRRDRIRLLSWLLCPPVVRRRRASWLLRHGWSSLPRCARDARDSSLTHYLLGARTAAVCPSWRVSTASRRRRRCCGSRCPRSARDPAVALLRWIRLVEARSGDVLERRAQECCGGPA